MNLELAPLATMWRIKSVNADPTDRDRATHLQEIGFIQGEHVSVLARALPGGVAFARWHGNNYGGVIVVG